MIQFKSMELKPIEETLQNIDHQKIVHATKVKKVVEYIKDGLSEDDAITLAGYDTFEYEAMKEEFPKVAEQIHKALLEYKHSLVKPLTAAAQGGDERLAQWMLEKRFGDEFNQKARTPQSDGETQTDLLITAIRDIQQGNTTTLIGLKHTTKKIIKELPLK